jgi:hypothetical protein
MFRKILRAIIPARFSPSGYLENLVRKRTHGRVDSGPFAGMRWISGRDGGHIHIPKLLGIYERELNPYIERACVLDFSHIIDIGAAEGYYAVGMALRNHNAHVIAFEMQEQERAVVGASSKLNNVADRLEIRGKCEPEDLECALTGAPWALVICDAEGYESALLDPTAVPSLHSAFVLVELHEFVERGITEKIRERFIPTHKITHIRQQDRTIADFPFQDFYTRCLPARYLRWAVSESRPERMSWFWMEPQAADRRVEAGR